MRIRPEGKLYIVEAAEAGVKVVKGVRSSSGVEFLAFREAPHAERPVKREEQIIALLKELGYQNDELIFSLPRNLATLRYLRVPSRDRQEIEKMLAFQAPRYMPYPAEELITGYESVRTDNEGQSSLSLVIVHRDMVAVYFKVSQLLALPHPTIVLSSFGLCRIFNVLAPGEIGPAVIVDIDDNHVEFAVSFQGALVFSRSVKIDTSHHDWKERLWDELARTLDLYSKEVPLDSPVSIHILKNDPLSGALFEFLGGRSKLKVKELPSTSLVRIADTAKSASGRITAVYSLLGLGLLGPVDELNLLSSEKKALIRRSLAIQDKLGMYLKCAIALLLVFTGMAVNVHNKSVRLEKLKSELQRVREDADPLLEIDRRIMLAKRAPGRSTGIEQLYALHQAVTADISFNTFEYDAAGKVIMRGQSRKLDEIFILARKLEAASAFKGYVVLVNYAMRRKTGSGDMFVFEIIGRVKG